MKKFIPLIFFLCFILIFHSTSSAQDNSGKKLFTSLSSEVTGVKFRNDLTEDGKLFYYTYEYLYAGGGVAAGDVNNDGLIDLYFSSTMGSNKLYLNEGNFKFKDVTASAGVGGGPGIKTGVNMVDINNDGYLDIFVCRSGPFDSTMRQKILYINNKNGTFTDRAAEYGLDNKSYTTQTYFFDYDRDNDLDVYLTDHLIDFSRANLIHAKMVNGKIVEVDDTTDQYVTGRLYQNNNGHFKDVTRKAGMINYAFGLSACIFDFNNDGWPDVFVANDFNKPDYLYINNKNGTFTDKMSDYFRHLSFSSMGSDINDINNDGYEDLMVVDMAVEDPVRQKQLFSLNQNYDKFHLMVDANNYYQYPRNVLQLNNGNGTFTDIGYYAGVAQTDWSWSPLIMDFDNDGNKDIFVSNGLFRDITDWDYKEFVLDSIKNLMAKGIEVKLFDWFAQIPQVKIPNYFFHNNGSLKFDNYSKQWSDAPPSFSNGASYADLDNDGDLDIIVNNVEDDAFILKNNLNEISKNNYIRFKFFKNKDSNQEVYGASVKLTDSNGNIQVQHYDPQRGYMSTMQHFLHFGTGSLNKISKAEIVFLSGKKTTLENISVNQEIRVNEDDCTLQNSLENRLPALFKESKSKTTFAYKHKENDFIDFKREPLIPYKCSRKGPYYSVADVNGDGRNDIYVGGASGFPGKLMIQNADGSYSNKVSPCFTADQKYEDCGVLFFDADGDKNQDLYVVSGGAEFNPGNALYQDRLYINDGKGNFKPSINALPVETINGSCVISLDYDYDGDLDLFVGGGVLPGKFPMHEKSFLLENTKGEFKDVTLQIAPHVMDLGIINSAVWTDIDGDQKNELILTGEWMPVNILKSRDGKLISVSARVNFSSDKGEKASSELSELTGWWNCIKTIDVDNDGDQDLVLGNNGTNSKIKAAMKEPCTVYAKDFDGNKSYDAVLGYYIDEKCYPMYHRDQLIDQMPFMRKKFIRYRHYAGKTMDEIFSAEQKNGMNVYKTNNFFSGILINEGNLNFRFEKFPERAQLSTISDFVFDDFNKDGRTDILVAGNSTDADVSTGNYDGQAVLLLSGKGDGKFEALPQTVFDKVVNGEVRKLIYNKEQKNVILLKNDTTSQVFTFN